MDKEIKDKSIKEIIDYLETSYTGAKAMDDIETMSKIALCINIMATSEDNELLKTINGMISEDWKERLLAEYNQLSIRLDKLKEYLRSGKDIDNKNLLLDQEVIMLDYKNILTTRLLLYGINLD